MLQAPVPNCRSFDPFSFQPDGLEDKGPGSPGAKDSAARKSRPADPGGATTQANLLQGARVPQALEAQGAKGCSRPDWPIRSV